VVRWISETNWHWLCWRGDGGVRCRFDEQQVVVVEEGKSNWRMQCSCRNEEQTHIHLHLNLLHWRRG
jgi:hypothetical protein